jgi:hypothetical protein
VWARGKASAEECPNSLVTPLSVEWIEKFHVWKLEGRGGVMALAAKEADAFLTLDKEWREANNGVQQSV